MYRTLHEAPGRWGRQMCLSSKDSGINVGNKTSPRFRVGRSPEALGQSHCPLFLQLKDERTQSFIPKDPSLQVSKRLYKMQQAIPTHDGRLQSGLAPPVPHCTSIPTMHVFPAVLLLPAPANTSPSLCCSQPLFPEISPDFCRYWFGKVFKVLKPPSSN